MSSNDKTRQKLMESMRKTKAGSAGNDQKAEVKAKPQDDKPVKKKVKRAPKAEAPKGTRQSVVDPYQTKPRVWPD